VATSVAAMQSQILAQVGYIESSAQITTPLAGMTATVAAVQSQLLAINTTILNVTNVTANRWAAAQARVVATRRSQSAAFEWASIQDTARWGVSLWLLLLPMISLPVILLGGYYKLRWMFEVNYIMGYLICLVAFVLCGAHWVVAVVTADGCLFTSAHEWNVTQVVPGDPGIIVDACVYNKSFVSLYKLESIVNFTYAIQYPTYPLATAFNFSTLNSFQADVHRFSLMTFSFNSTWVDQSITYLNTFTTQNQIYGTTETWSRENASTCICSQYTLPVGNDVQCGKAQLAAVALINTETYLYQIIAQIQNNVSLVVAQSTNWRQSILAVSAILNSNISTLLAPITKEASSIIYMGYCGALGNRYFALKTTVCNPLMNSIAFVSVAFFFLGVLHWFIIVASTVLNKRIAHVYVPPQDRTPVALALPVAYQPRKRAGDEDDEEADEFGAWEPGQLPGMDTVVSEIELTVALTAEEETVYR
jgi:hypothetical protein